MILFCSLFQCKERDVFLVKEHPDPGSKALSAPLVFVTPHPPHSFNTKPPPCVPRVEISVGAAFAPLLSELTGYSRQVTSRHSLKPEENGSFNVINVLGQSEHGAVCSPELSVQH